MRLHELMNDTMLTYCTITHKSSDARFTKTVELTVPLPRDEITLATKNMY